jgi:hypothetical protein
MVRDIYYDPLRSLHYKRPLQDRYARKPGYSAPFRPEDIDWAWIVEEQRRASPAEIRKLCKAGSRR